MWEFQEYQGKSRKWVKKEGGPTPRHSNYYRWYHPHKGGSDFTDRGQHPSGWKLRYPLGPSWTYPKVMVGDEVGPLRRPHENFEWIKDGKTKKARFKDNILLTPEQDMELQFTPKGTSNWKKSGYGSYKEVGQKDKKSKNYRLYDKEAGEFFDVDGPKDNLVLQTSWRFGWKDSKWGTYDEVSKECREDRDYRLYNKETGEVKEPKLTEKPQDILGELQENFPDFEWKDVRDDYIRGLMIFNGDLLLEATIQLFDTTANIKVGYALIEVGGNYHKGNVPFSLEALIIWAEREASRYQEQSGKILKAMEMLK